MLVKTLEVVKQEISDMEYNYDCVMLAKDYSQDEYIDGWVDAVRKYEKENHCKIKFEFMSNEVTDVTFDV